MRSRINRWISIGLAALLVGGLFAYLFPKDSVSLSKSYVSIGIERTIIPQDIIPIGEVTGNRTANSKTYYLGNNKYALAVAVGRIHYKDAQGNYQDINTQIVGGVMNQADYTFRLLQNTFNAGQVVEFSVGADYVRLQPMALEYSNNLSQLQQISMPQSVTGTVTNTPVQLLPGVGSYQGKVIWQNAYGNNRHFEWLTQPTRLLKLLTIQGFNDLPPPTQAIINGGSPYLRLNMVFADSDMDIYVDGVLWRKQANSQVQSFGRVEFRRNGITLWDFAPLLYWDSGGNEGESVKTLRRSGNNLFLEIRVPYSWLQTAVYPIYIDTTIDVAPNANNWDGEEHASGGTPTYNYDSSLVRIFSNTDTTSTNYVHGYYGFPVTIPVGATIDVAYLQLKPEDGGGDDMNFVIYGEDTATPVNLQTSGDIDGRVRTTANVSWVATGIGTAYVNSPAITSVVQELEDSYDYSAGAYMGIIGIANTNLNRTHYGRSATQANAANLYIEYTESGTPDISVSPTTYNFGTIAASSTTNTTTSYFTVTNNSTIQTDQTISVTTANWSGGAGWTHSDTATAGADTAGMKANKGGTWGTGDVIVKNAAPNYIAENQAASTNYTFGLSLIAPTSFSDGVEKTITVRITAAAG